MDSTSRAHQRLEHVANFLLTGTSVPVRVPPARHEETRNTDSVSQVGASLPVEAVICEHLAGRGYEALTRYLHHAVMTAGPISLIAADPHTIEIKNLLHPSGSEIAVVTERELPAEADLGTVLRNLSNQGSRLIVQLSGIDEPAIVALASQCRRISVLVEPGQPTLIEAYKIIKQLSAACDVEFGIIACNHNDEQSAQETFQRLRAITTQFLQIELGDHGRVPSGPWISENNVATFTTKTEKGLGVHSQLLGRLAGFLADQGTFVRGDEPPSAHDFSLPVDEVRGEPSPEPANPNSRPWGVQSGQTRGDKNALVTCFFANPPAPFERLLSLSPAARCPGYPSIAIAVSPQGQLHCVGIDVIQICEVLGWLNDHRPLLVLAHPQITIADSEPAAIIISSKHMPSVPTLISMLKADVHHVRAHEVSQGEQHGVFFETAASDGA